VTEDDVAEALQFRPLSLSHGPDGGGPAGLSQGRPGPC
jgi:hypothetical protein